MKSIWLQQTGTALVSTLLLAPIVITLLLMFAVTWVLTSQVRKQNQLCYEWTLDIQAKQADHINQLLSLNPKVKSLRAALKKAEALLRAAKLSGNPGAILAAQTQKMAIESQLQILRLEQNKIMAQAKFELSKDLAKLNLDLRKSGVDPRIKASPTQLPVAPESPTQPYPTYQVVPTFEAQQALQVEWKWKIQASLLPWLKSLDIDSRYVTRSCAANIHQRSQKWKSELRPAKY